MKVEPTRPWRNTPPPTILVVEDDPDDQIFIKDAFVATGMNGTIHIVNSGEEAIAYMTGQGKYADRSLYAYPTFITTDLKMPRGDGFAVLEYLKAHSSGARIPAVVLSASVDRDDIKRAYLLGAGSYHLKPNSIEGLRQLAKVLHDYWMTCVTPEVDGNGHSLQWSSAGKLGERFG